MPDVEASAKRQCQGRQSFCHAGDSICAVGIVPVEGLQHDMRPRQGYAEVLWVHDHKVTKETLAPANRNTRACLRKLQSVAGKEAAQCFYWQQKKSLDLFTKHVITDDCDAATQVGSQ